MDDTKSDKSNWRKLIIITDGLQWEVDTVNSNTSMLELKEICRELLKKYDVYKLE